MASQEASYRLAQKALQGLHEFGIRQVVFCPGGRNAFLLHALTHHFSHQFEVAFHFEERSAGFYALGISKRVQQPVAVIVTSGTAAGELIPACMEAFFSGVPIVFITADRPKRFEGSGAPQTANQAGLLNSHVLAAQDVDENETWIPQVSLVGPTHWNLRFEDPNQSADVAITDQKSRCPHSVDAYELVGKMKNPLVIIGELNKAEAASVQNWASQSGCVCLSEPLSGLREVDFESSYNVRCKSFAMNIAEKLGQPFDGVIRVGGVPTLRFWRDLEDRYLSLPVSNFSRLPFSGLGRACQSAFGNLQDILPKLQSNGHQNYLEDFRTLDHKTWQDWRDVMSQYPKSEPTLVHRLSLALPANGNIFLGNSMPIREWDSSADLAPNSRTFFGSRGLNGIDGQVSAFYGGCLADRPNFALIGDLGLMYDLAGFWAAASGKNQPPGTVIVINNGGGRIFDSMFQEPQFQNLHSVSFHSLAELWNLPYFRTDQIEGPLAELENHGIVEIQPDHQQTRLVNLAWKELQP